MKLMIKDESGAKYRAATPGEIIVAAQRELNKRLAKGKRLDCAATAKQYFTLHFATLEHEVFSVAFVDNQHRVIAIEDMFQGTINAAAVYPREVAKRALYHNAAAVMFAHNHPSGNLKPSMADEEITAKLKRALGLLDVQTLDHILVAGGEALSFADKGLI